MNFKVPFSLLHSVVFFATIVASEPSSYVAPEKETYGKTWMYFPDGDDIPRRISLEMPSLEFMRRSYWVDGEVEYRLYTKYNKEDYVLLDESAIPINNSDIKIIENLQKAPIKLVTHGWESSADKSAVINIKNAYLEWEDVNVIGVNWDSIADSILYPIVAIQTFSVGNSVGKFIDALSELYSIPGDRIHLIGHSLGAHVMGNAGYTTKLNVSQITGLDPARPLFEYPSVPNRLKLDSSDANFVDVIHTCMGILGVENPIGHADFFPNNGEAPQPGCGDPSAIFEACSHSRSHYFFAESIRHPKSFPAYPCSNWTAFNNNKCKISTTFLGENVNKSAFGKFYLKTNSRAPYGRGLSFPEDYVN